MRKWLSASSLPLDRSLLSEDLTAGLTFAVVNVPQAMANALLATVNPVCGLYTLMVATPVGALFTSSVFMNVSTTGALSVATGDALADVPAGQKLAALVTLAVLIGLFQLAFGLLKLGSLIRFVSHSVMTGFVSGIALLIVLGAISDLTGYTSPYARHLFRLADTVLNLNRLDPATVGLGVSTIALIVGFGYTRAKKFALILALGVVTLASFVLSAAFGVDSVALVRDIAEIPRSLPGPMLPDLSLLPTLLLPALAIGVVGLVQGAGVGQSYPNPDGRYPDASRDFTGQGLGNIAAGVFQGIPGGGSMSGTAVTVNAGARSRWANISAGVFVVLIVLLLVDLVKLIPMAALGGLLVVVGIQNLQPEQIATVWRTNRVARTGMVLTLAATLTMPLQYAIVVGVAISTLLYVFQSSNRIKVVEIVPVEGGFPIERPAPARLPSSETTVLHVYGSLFYAAATAFERGLPSADEARGAVAILIVRERPEIGSTLIGVLRRYSEALRSRDGKLMLAGVSPELYDQLERTGMVGVLGEENLFRGQPQLGAAMNEALAAAREWRRRER